MTSTSTANDQVEFRPDRYPFWTNDWFLALLLSRFHLSSWLIGIIAFAAYWGAPFTVAAWEGNLHTAQVLESRIEQLEGFPRTQEVLRNLSSRTRMEEGLAYLNDRSHFLFALLLAFGGVAGPSVLRGFQSTVIRLREDDLPVSDERFVHDTYMRYHRLGNHWLTRVVAAGLAITTLIVFLHFHTSDHFSYWWGSSQNGRAGLLLAIIEMGMVYFGTLCMFLVGTGSIMLAKIFDRGINLRVFHPDGSNGLGTLGRMIFLLWGFALILGGEVFVTVQLGYLGIEKLQLTWLLALLALLTLPIAAILPLYSSLRAIQKARRAQLKRFEGVLTQAFDEAGLMIEENRPQEAIELVSRLNELRGVHEVLTTINIWPFNPKAILIVAIAYSIQVILTLRELLSFF